MSGIRCNSVLTFLVAALFGAACAAGSRSDEPKDAPIIGGDLGGEWSLTSANVAAIVHLSQSAAAIAAAGTYSKSAGAEVGCGGETIPQSGTVSMTAKFSGDTLAGRATFSGTWNPPFTAILVARDTAIGSFMSVDRGGCPLRLIRVSIR